MASEVSIVNVALSRLGEQPIASLGDDSIAARTANRIYATERDSLLRAHPWNFAIKRSALGLLAGTPAYAWSYQYELPNDCLRVLAMNDDEECGDPGDVFKVEGRMLLTNEGTASIRYVAQITDTSQFDSLFVDCLAQKLAAELADPLTGSTTRADEHMKKYLLKLQDAQTIDGQEGSPDIMVDNSLIDVR